MEAPAAVVIETDPEPEPEAEVKADMEIEPDGGVDGLSLPPENAAVGEEAAAAAVAVVVVAAVSPDHVDTGTTDRIPPEDRSSPVPAESVAAAAIDVGDGAADAGDADGEGGKPVVPPESEAAAPVEGNKTQESSLEPAEPAPEPEPEAAPEESVRGPEAGVYVGETAYAHFTVADNLEMYLRQQVFCNYSQRIPYYLRPAHRVAGGAEEWVPKPLADDGSGGALALESLAFAFHEDMLEIESARKPTVSVGSDVAVAVVDQKSAEADTDGTADEPVAYVFMVTNRNLYILHYDPREVPLRSSAWGKILGSSTNKLHSKQQAQLTFSDAPVFKVHRCHPLRDFKQYTLFFSYQRCALEFVDTSDSNEASTLDSDSTVTESVPAAAPACSAYVVITRDKPRTIGFITRLYQLANTIRQQYHPSPSCPLRISANGTGTGDAGGVEFSGTDPSDCTCVPRLPKVVIKNNEGALLDELHRWFAVTPQAQLEQEDDGEVLYYQMLYQLIGTAGSAEELVEGPKASRSVVLTPAYMLLCEETLDSDSLDLKVVDYTAYTDVCAIKAEDNPLCVTFTVKQAQKTKKRMSVFGGAVPKRQWTLCATNRTIIEKATQEVRRLCKAKGNTDIK